MAYVLPESAGKAYKLLTGYGYAGSNYSYMEMWTPSVSSTIEGILEWFNPFAEMLWPWARVALAIILIFGIIGFVIYFFVHAAKSHRS